MTAALTIVDWPTLGEDERRSLLRRPAQRDTAALLSRTAQIVGDVRVRGDAALREYTASLDGVRLDAFAVGPAEFEQAASALSREQLAALRRAIETITRFHETQSLEPVRVQTAPGVTKIMIDTSSMRWRLSSTSTAPGHLRKRLLPAARWAPSMLPISSSGTRTYLTQ